MKEKSAWGMNACKTVIQGIFTAAITNAVCCTLVLFQSPEGAMESLHEVKSLPGKYCNSNNFR